MELDLGPPLLPREQPSNISFQVIWKLGRAAIMAHLKPWRLCLPGRWKKK